MWDEFFRPLEHVEFVPATNIIQTDDEFRVVLALPGYTPDQLSMDIAGNGLEIRGKGGSPNDEKEIYLRREIWQLPFRYRVELPDRALADGITAELQGGMLTVRIPLQGKRVIPIQIQNADKAKSIEA